jgi:hypothetical protein
MDGVTGTVCGLAGVLTLSVSGLAEAGWRSAGGAVPAGWSVVAAGGVVSVVVGGRLGAVWVMPAFWLIGVVGVLLAVVDVREHRLPFGWVVPLYAVCGVCFVVASVAAGTFEQLVRAAAACTLTLVVFVGVAMAAGGRFGLGDVVVLGVLAGSLGWWGWRWVIVGIGVGFLLAAVGAVVSWARHGRGRPVVLGPALLAGWLVAVGVS